MRAEHWDVKLIDWAATHTGQPFIWGERDCGSLCFEAFDVLTEGHLAQEYRGKYDGEFSCIRFCKKNDVTICSILELAGCVPVARNFQQRGDFLLVDTGDWIRGHVCLGEKSISAHPDHGTQLLDTTEIVAHPQCVILRAN